MNLIENLGLEKCKAFEKYVMSLEKFKNRKPVFVFQLDENGDYDNRDVYDLHHAWVASAQREGYKLVPLDPPEGMDMKICDLVNHRVDVFEADRIYKAMIEAGDDEQDDYWVLVDEFEAMIGVPE